MAEQALAHHAGLWSEVVLGFRNAPFHNEWYDLMISHPRLCVVAPREHAKTQVFSVNATAHHAIFNPGSWQYVFSSTLDQAKHILERVLGVIQQTEPRLLQGAPKRESTEIILSNYSRVTVAGAGKAVRGAHPDRIVGDDVLTSETAHTNHQRLKMEEWWFGTVSPMAHGGVQRPIGWGRAARAQGSATFGSTTIILVGTPFHQGDLLMSMRMNPIYHFRRYAAIFSETDLIDGTWAVEIE